MDHNFTTYYFIERFDREEIFNLNKKINIILRNYNTKFNSKVLVQLVSFCHKIKHKIFLSNDISKAIQCGFDGVYLPSFNKSTIYNCFKFKKNFDVIGSAHNVMELNTKIRQQVKSIFIAPVFKKKINKLGIYGFLKFRSFTNRELIVLGGVTSEKMNMINFLNAEGFAAIDYFQKKRPL